MSNILATTTVLLSGILLFSSCKKVHLKDESKVLEGTWEWTRTVKRNNTCNPPVFTTTLNPNSENILYSIQFYEKGVVEFYKNGLMARSGKLETLLFDITNPPSTVYKYSFVAHFKDSEIGSLKGFVGADSLRLTENFPFEDSNCIDYSNYFVKK